MAITVPQQEIGSKTDLSASKDFSDLSIAYQEYLSVKQRLMDINFWDSYNDKMPVTYMHADEKGQSTLEQPKVGHHIGIKAKPKNPQGDGYDWVEIIKINESINEETPYYGITVKPCADPRGIQERTAHFFDEKATNTFMVTLANNELTVSVQGRNEVKNKDVPLKGRLRNTLVAVGGKLGMSPLHWDDFVAGILHGKK